MTPTNQIIKSIIVVNIKHISIYLENLLRPRFANTECLDCQWHPFWDLFGVTLEISLPANVYFYSAIPFKMTLNTWNVNSLSYIFRTQGWSEIYKKENRYYLWCDIHVFIYMYGLNWYVWSELYVKRKQI